MIKRTDFLFGFSLIFLLCGLVLAQVPQDGLKVDRSKQKIVVEAPPEAKSSPEGTKINRRYVAKPEEVSPPEKGIPTKVLVRALARDAKIIYDTVGGAHFTFKDAATGRLLAEGIQQGSSGDTDLIMVKPRQRGVKVFDTPGSAGFVATLLLNEPTMVEITAEGPLKYPDSMQRSTKTVLLLPGQDVLGEGIILEIHGFVVSLLNPGEEKKANSSEPLDVKANVTMMCGCPIESKGIWDADKIRVVARILKDNQVIEEAPLKYAGEKNTFTGKIKPVPPGEYQLQVLAIDPLNANFGVAHNKLVFE